MINANYKINRHLSIEIINSEKTQNLNLLEINIDYNMNQNR